MPADGIMRNSWVLYELSLLPLTADSYPLSANLERLRKSLAIIQYKLVDRNRILRSLDRHQDESGCEGFLTSLILLLASRSVPATKEERVKLTRKKLDGQSQLFTLSQDCAAVE